MCRPIPYESHQTRPPHLLPSSFYSSRDITSDRNVPAAGALAVSARAGVPDGFVRHGCGVGFAGLKDLKERRVLLEIDSAIRQDDGWYTLEVERLAVFAVASVVVVLCEVEFHKPNFGGGRVPGVQVA